MAIYRGEYPRINDEELVLVALIGDLEAFDELVRRFRGAVTTVAQQVVGSREVAEDVAQESLLLAFKALPQLEEPAKFAGWLCAITRHRARRVAAREHHSEATAPSEIDQLILENSHELGTQPPDELIRSVERAAIVTALSKLAPDYQIVLRLRYYEEWPLERIVDFLSLPMTTVKWRLHHGRQLMRRALAESVAEAAPLSGCISQEKFIEVNNHGRKQTQQSGTATHAADASRDGQNRQRSQSDRQPARRCAHLGIAIQCDPALSGE